MGMAAILFNGVEPFKHIANTLSIQKSSYCFRVSFGLNRLKLWEEMSKIDFYDAGCSGHLGFSINQFSISFEFTRQPDGPHQVSIQFDHCL